MSRPPFFDPPTPRIRKLMGAMNIIGYATAMAIIVAGIAALYSTGQLSASLWMPFLEPALWLLLLKGLGATFRAVVLCVALSAVIGSALAVARLLSPKYVGVAIAAWVELFRAIPALLIILFLFLTYAQEFTALGRVIEAVGGTGFGGIVGADQMRTLGPLVVAVVLYHSALFSEIFRAGIQSLPKGQAEAALSLGLSRRQTIRLVLLPQAVRIMAPSLVSETIRTIKATALGYVIGYQELLRTGQIIAAAYHNVIPVSFILIGIYAALCHGLSLLVGCLERQRRNLRMRQTPSIPS